MTLQNYFDLAKKQLEGGNLDEGFLAKNGTLYHAYHTNAEWTVYLDMMERKYNSAYLEYKEGDGGELFEKRYPPKMASYGSSSRFIFELSKDIPGFHFEKKLGICVPARNSNQEAQASLDGYYEPKCIYVEAKCREIYAESHPEFNVKYKEYYQYLETQTEGRFRYEIKEAIDKNGELIRKVYFNWDDKPIAHFDLKQILCHLLGIAKKTILDNGAQVPTLLYLVYRPSERHLELVGHKVKAESIRACWETEKEEATSVDILLLYNRVVHFLYERKNIGQHLSKEDIERISNSFRFRFCDQNEYHSLIR